MHAPGNWHLHHSCLYCQAKYFPMCMLVHSRVEKPCQPVAVMFSQPCPNMSNCLIDLLLVKALMRMANELPSRLQLLSWRERILDVEWLSSTANSTHPVDSIWPHKLISNKFWWVHMYLMTQALVNWPSRVLYSSSKSLCQSRIFSYWVHFNKAKINGDTFAASLQNNIWMQRRFWLLNKKGVIIEKDIN